MGFKKKPSERMKKLQQEHQLRLNRDATIVGQEAVNFFKLSFRNQGWNGERFEAWKPRKKADKGRAILIGSGKLRNSIRILRVGYLQVTVGSDMPYAQAHNEGLEEIVGVSSHTRNLYRKAKIKYSSLATRKERTKTVKVTKGQAQVKQHSRLMKMPQRKFMGNSPFLNQRIHRLLKIQTK